MDSDLLVRTEPPASLALSVEPVTRQVGKGKVGRQGVGQMMGLIAFQVVLPRNWNWEERIDGCRSKHK